MVDLSIIIVSWNAKAFLLECLRSLTGEIDDRRTEIIVVDNASTDGSPEAVESEFPNVKLLRNPTNLGFAKANNIGIKQSAGQYVCLVNSDVKILPGCFTRLIDYMEQHSGIGMLGPKVLNADLTLQLSHRRLPTLWNRFCRALALDTLFPNSTAFGHGSENLKPNATAVEVEVLSGSFWMVRREALDRVGLLDEVFFMYAEDLDWCKRFRDAGWKVVYFPGAGVIHYGGASSANAPVRFYLELQRANLQYWKKHHSRPAQIVFVFILILHQVVRIFRGILWYLLKPASANQIKPKIKRSVSCLRWLLFDTGHIGYQHE
jgi:hypothetical protein